MILGASILQLPAILKAKEMGLEVIVVDYDKDAIGFQHADHCLNISTIDTEKILDAAKEFKIDGIMTLATDLPVRSVAAVVEELNLIGVDKATALLATDKGYMRECLRENNVPIPEFYIVDNYDDYQASIEKLNGKIIVKPVDNSGSRGIFFIDKSDDDSKKKYAFSNSVSNSKSGRIIVEHYMEGDEVSVEAISQNGSIKIIAITDKLTSGKPRFVEMGHTQPSRHSRNIQDSIIEISKNAVKSIGLLDGPSHTEVVLTHEGPKIVEIGARLGGDNITTHLVPYSTGFDMVKCSIEISIGLNPDFSKKFHKGSCIRYFNSPVGRILSIDGVKNAEHISGVKEIVFTKSIGQIVGEVKSSLDRVGFVISQADTALEAEKICERVINMIDIQVDNNGVIS